YDYCSHRPTLRGKARVAFTAMSSKRWIAT
ncbi:MAG: hypothetical protein ACI8ZW_001028, partial [Yoonia sp.]